MAIPIPPNPTNPIPNNPFFFPESNFLQGTLGPFVLGSSLNVSINGVLEAVGGGPAVTYLAGGPGISVSANTGNVNLYNTGVLSITAGTGIGISGSLGNFTITNTLPAGGGGGGSGTVTQINTGDGLTGGPITTSGTIALTNTGVGAATYTNPTITVDAKGRITAASPGTSLSSVSGSAPIVVTGSTNAIISVNQASPTIPGVVCISDSISCSSSLVAASAQAVKTAYNLALAALPCSVLVAQGDLITSNTVGTPLRIPAGTEGTYLKVCTACAGTGGLTWDTVALCAGTVTSITAGTGLTGGTITASGTIALDTACVIAPSALSSKGALLTATASGAPIALGSGGNGQVLSVNTLCSANLEWVTPTAAVPCSAFNVKGDLLTGTGPATYTALGVGTNGKILAANSACTAGMEWVTPNAGTVSSVTGVAPISVTTGATPAISITSASTTALGAVQLFNGLNSDSTDLALTAAQGKCLQGQITGLLTVSNIDLAGTLNANTGCVVSVTSAGTAAGYTVTAVLPNASLTTKDTYVIATTAGTMTPPGGVSTVVTQGDWFLVSEVSAGVYSWQFLNVGFDAPAATTAVAGISCLSTNALALAGTDTTTALTPAAAASAYFTKSVLAAKGDILGASAACTPSALTVGSDGQMLVACTAATTGLCWANQPAAATTATPTVAGIVIGSTNATNAALGCNAALSNTTGTGNVAVGLDAGCANLAGVNNVFVGNGAGVANLASGNVGIGTSALSSNVNASRNVAVGESALTANVSGEYNTAAGWQALCASTTASSNVALGALAGKNITTGTTNVIIGANVNAPVATGDCQLAIGYNDTFCWLTGCSNLNIKPGAGILDCAGSAGTAGQVLMSNGANKICWGSGSDATPTLRGALYGCSGTTTTGVGCNILTSLGAGLCNTAVGCSVLSSIVNGGSNTAVGYKAGSSVITNGSFNVAMGSLALGNATGTGNISNNTAIGMRSLAALTAGSCNVAVGSCSMCSQTNGGSNVAIGYASLWNSTTGIGNVAIGFGSLLSSSTAGFNIGVGYASMQANTTGTCNIGIGICSHDNLDGGCNNVALGFSAGSNLSTGCYNVSIGDSVSLASPTGSCQLAIGFSATENWLTGTSTKAIKPGAGIIDCANQCGGSGQVLTSTGSNSILWSDPTFATTNPSTRGIVVGCTTTNTAYLTALGAAAIFNNISGKFIAALGSRSLYSNTSGCYNNALGVEALYNNTTGCFNTAVGFNASYCSTSGSQNVSLGACAGYNVTTGSQNVALGPNVLLATDAGSCQLAIGFSNTDNWLTGTSTKAIKPGAGIIDCANSCGTVGQYLWTTGTNKIVWSASSPSDTRDKEVLGPVPTALPVVQQIEPITYRWKERESDVAQEEVIYGFSAQQLQEVDSVLVDDSDPDHLRIHDRKIVPLLVKAIQELSAKVEALEAKLESNG